jgi:putrescine aminotransferase
MATTSTSSLAAADLAHVIHPLTRHGQLDELGPVIVVEGRGSEVVLDDGRVGIDGSAGLWNVNVGHGRKELAAVAAAQMEKLAFSPTFGMFSHPPAIELATRIAELAPGDLDAVHFTSGGSEANESAFKLARYWWQLNGKPSKQIVLSHDRGYHGLSLGAASATRLSAYHGDFGQLADDFASVPAPYTYRCSAGVPCDPATCPVCTGKALEQRIAEIGADSIAAFILEPVLGTGGVIPPPLGYLRAVREVCDGNEILMIADEVITGFGRTGRWFGVNHEDVVPDMLTFAKGVTSGYLPLGGVIVRGAIRDALHSVPGDKPLMHGFTYSGHPVACAVALENIEIVERERLVERTAEAGARLAAGLEALYELGDVGDVRGRGLMCGVELVANRATRERFAPSAARGAVVTRRARELGLISRPLLDDVLLLSPPLVITDEQIDRCVEILAEAISQTSS